MDTVFIVERILPALNRGLWVTVQLIIPSMLLGFLGGVVLGSIRAYGWPWMRKAGNAYTALLRGVPLVVQLFILYNALPKIHIYLDGFSAAVLGFILCSAAYHSEYIRGALLSIRPGQIRAAEALGFSKGRLLVSIIIPQALRRALPGCGNEFIYLIKYSSLAYMTTCVDLTAEAMNLASYTYRFTEIFLVAGAYYLLLTSLATWTLHKLEQLAYIPGFGHR
ncbi:amino acid ABC transporter permease [Desulfovibrio sp. OttesenSCG-928-C14]|nr:amino acid ABC transporter permease [Desulfovibrio sp. OttesenSCG-928-C14]